MKRKISSFSVLLIMSALALVGIFSLPFLNLQYLPSYKDRTLTVSYSYPGFSAKALEAEITSPLEASFSALEGVSEISSNSSSEGGSISVSWAKGTDMDEAKFRLSAAIRNIYSSMPQGFEFPEIRYEQGSRKAMLVYVFKSSLPNREIAEIADKMIVSKLRNSEDISDLRLSGSLPLQLEVVMDDAKSRSLGFGISDIETCIRRNLSDANIGLVRSGNGLMPLILRLSSKDSFKDMVVGKFQGRIVMLSDIATWKITESEPISFFRVNGLNTVNLSITISEKSNILRASEILKTEIGRLSSALPAEVSLSLMSDTSDYVHKELNKIYLRTLVSLAILLLFVLVASRSVKRLFIIVFTLAVNILIALAIYAFLGISLHIYTLAGITVSLGIVIDTSIVMIDHYSRFKDRKAFGSLLSATATTLGALAVVFLLPEKTGMNLRDFSVVVIINLLLSLLISYLFIPSLMDYVLDKEGVTAKEHKELKWKKLYASYIVFAQKWRFAILLLLVAVFGLPFCVLPLPAAKWKENKLSPFESFVNNIVSSEFYSSHRELFDTYLSSSFGLFYKSLSRYDFYRIPEEKTISVRAGMQEGASVKQLNRVVREMEAFILKYDEVRVFTTSIDSYDNALINIFFKPEYAYSHFPVKLKSEIISYARNLGGANWQVWGIDDSQFNNYISSSGKGYRISLYGYNYEELTRYANTLVSFLSKNSRVKGAEIWSGGLYRAPKTQFVLSYDFEALTALGVNPYSYYNALSDKIGQRIAGRTMIDGDLSDVCISSSERDVYDLWHLSHSPISVDSTMVTLSAIGKIERKRTDVSISRKNQSYSLDVAFDFIGPNSLYNKVESEAIDYMNNAVLPLGYRAERSRGEYWGENTENYAYLIFLIIAIIFVILAISFESLYYPIPVIMMIPLSFIGVFLVFGLTDFVFDTGGFAAFVMLSGIVVNAGIYLISTYLSSVGASSASYNDRLEAYLEAFSRKIQPISLTLISSVLGLLPFLSDGPKEVFWFDFALATISGLVFSVFVLIFILPLFTIRRRPQAR